MLRHIKLVLFLSMISMNNLIAAEVPESKIIRIAPWSPHVDIKMAAEHIDPENCGDSQVYRIDLISDPGSEAKLSTILAAAMAGKPVSLVLNGCVGKAPKIWGIYFKTE